MLALLLFAGCVKHDFKYLYRQPKILIYDTLTHKEVLDGQTLEHKNQLFTVLMPTDDYSASNLFAAFSNQAYASKPAPATYKPVERIKDVKIIALFNYNAQLPAGSDLVDSCTFVTTSWMDNDGEVYARPYTEAGAEYSKQQLLDKLNQSDGGIYSIIKRVSFRIKATPASLSIQQFAIVFITEQSSRITDTTVRFLLKP